MLNRLNCQFCEVEVQADEHGGRLCIDVVCQMIGVRLMVFERVQYRHFRDFHILKELIRICQKCNVPHNLIYNFKSEHMSQKYNKWNEYQDQSLTQVITKSTSISWKTVAYKLKTLYQINRTTKQCRERWNYHLNKPQQPSQWTQQQNQQLINLHQSLGSSWRQIIPFFQFRSQNDVKNHFYSLIRKSLRQMCQYAQVKTSQMKLDEIKPITLSRVLILGRKVQGNNAENGFDEAEMDVYDVYYGMITPAQFQEMSSIINSFIDNSYKQNKVDKSIARKQKILQTLKNIQDLNSLIIQNQSIHHQDASNSNEQKPNKLEISTAYSDLKIKKISSAFTNEIEHPEILKMKQTKHFIRCVQTDDIFWQDQQDEMVMEDRQLQLLRRSSIQNGIDKNNAEFGHSKQLTQIMNSRFLENIKIMSKDSSEIEPQEERKLSKEDSQQSDDLQIQCEDMFKQLNFILESQPQLPIQQEMRMISTPSIKNINSFEQFLKLTSSTI